MFRPEFQPTRREKRPPPITSLKPPTSSLGFINKPRKRRSVFSSARMTPSRRCSANFVLAQSRRAKRVVSSIASNPAVGLILSWLTWLDHPGDTASYFHVAHSAWGSRLGLEVNPADSLPIARRYRQLLWTQGYGQTLEEWVNSLSLGLDDRNVGRLQQLIELAHSFDDRPSPRPSDFVEFVEATRVDDPRPAPVRVMNIHQSKGLEFDIVLLPELDPKLRGIEPKLIVGGDDVLAPATVACRYVSKEEQQLLPEPIQKAFQNQLVRDCIEQLCLLYVALTRAKYQLHLVIAPPSAREKNIPATMAGILRAGLQLPNNLTPGQVAWSIGDPTSHQQISGENRLAPPAPVVLVPRSDSPSAAQPTRLVHPSAIHRQRTGLHERLALVEQSATERGSLIHAWLSQWSWMDDDPPADADLLGIARRDFANEPNPEQTLAEVKRALEKPDIRDAFARPAGEVDLWRERRFIAQTTAGLVSGTFDRVVVIYSAGQAIAARLIDFKTDRLRDQRGIEPRARHYRDQLELYRLALSRCSASPPPPLMPSSSSYRSESAGSCLKRPVVVRLSLWVSPEGRAPTDILCRVTLAYPGDCRHAATHPCKSLLFIAPGTLGLLADR